MGPLFETATRGLLIAGSDREICWRLAHLFIGSEYRITVTESASTVLGELLRGGSEVVLLGGDLEGRKPAELVPLLKRCRPSLSVILVSGSATGGVLRRLREEGIFYHALQPADATDAEELREVVRCAFTCSASRQGARPTGSAPAELHHN